MNGFMGHGWGMGFGWIFGLVVLAAIIWLIVKAVNTPSDSSPHSNEPSALDILNKRYARGEIKKAEYEAIKRDLME